MDQGRLRELGASRKGGEGRGNDTTDALQGTDSRILETECGVGGRTAMEREKKNSRARREESAIVNICGE
jgi:hypothetical protein